jgi:HSP20 family protein
MQNGFREPMLSAVWQPFTTMDGLNEMRAHLGQPERRAVTVAVPAPRPAASAAPAGRAGATDVYETKEAVVVTMDLPGHDAGAIELDFHKGVLTIRSALVAKEDAQAERAYLLSERATGLVERSFRLPDTVDPERIDASFDRGVLTVALHKREEAKPRRIEVKSPA